MSIAKVVRLRVDATDSHALDRALAHARDAFSAESGTLHWEVYDAGDAAERTLVEIFADAEAVRRHDESAAVATLLSELERLDVDVVAADQFSRTPLIDKEP